MRPSPPAALVLAGALVALAPRACPERGDPVWVRIPPNAPVEEVAESLAARRIVRSAERFTRYAQRTGREWEIEPGAYLLRPGTSERRVLARLRAGRPEALRIRVEAGVWLVELAPVLSRVFAWPLDSVVAATRDSALRAGLGTRAETLEGYLPPGLYYVPVTSTPLGWLRALADTFETRWRPEWTARLVTLGMSRHDAVTLASIIEGEGGDSSELALISSVYHNRLARGLRLEADPTVVYARGSRNRLYNKHYAFESPYNTYQVKGLPPGPIGQPSSASLQAALHPAETAYLYFVATPDGRHRFAQSYREHLANIRALRRR